jgi:hypothetical protein
MGVMRSVTPIVELTCRPALQRDLLRETPYNNETDCKSGAGEPSP